MARIYAGILGLLSFLTCLVRGFMHGESPSSILWLASLSVPVFAMVGGILGALAAQTVEDSVRGQLEAELAARPPAATGASKTPS